jgi:hypothetical protein
MASGDQDFLVNSLYGTNTYPVGSVTTTASGFYTGGGSYSFPLTDVSISCGTLTGGVTVGAFAVGDRVEIKEGYEDAGRVGIFKGRSNAKQGKCKVAWFNGAYDLFINPTVVLEESLKAKPYTKEERIMRAVEDLEDRFDGTVFSYDDIAWLYAIIEAGY